MRGRTVLAALAAVILTVAILPSAWAGRSRDVGPNLSTREGIASYLTSIGVDPATAVFQDGLRNYAGPDCPGAGWNCTDTSRPVVQTGSVNHVKCTTPTCTIVQTSTSGENEAECAQRSSLPNVTLSCSITQGGAGTEENEAEVGQTCDARSGLSQDCTLFVDVDQTSDDSNSVEGLQTCKQSTRASSSAPTAAIQQLQDCSVTARVTQHAAENSSRWLQFVSQQAEANGRALISQGQNPSDDDASVFLFELIQVSDPETNESLLAQLLDQRASARSSSAVGPITQIQGPAGEGVHGMEAFVHQSTTEPSISAPTAPSSGDDGTEGSVSRNLQAEFQSQTANGPGSGIVQTQTGHKRCCTVQTGGSNAFFKIDQLLRQVQSAPAGAVQSQDDDSDGELDTTGTGELNQRSVQRASTGADGTINLFIFAQCDVNCTGNQFADSNGTVETNTASGTEIQIFTECFEGVCESGDLGG